MWSPQNFVASISLLLIGTATITSAIFSDWLDNTSVQDVLTSGIGQNASEKIIEKIINTVKQYTSDCPNYKEKLLIDLSTEGFKFPQKEIQIDLGSDIAILHDIRISELSSTSTKRRSYSTSIKCESARTTKIEVKLPKDLEISAHVKMHKITNSTSEYTYAPVFDHSPTGSLSLILKDNLFSKQFFTQANYDEIIRWKLLHSKSVVSLDIAPEFQIPIYNILQAIFDQVELPLRQFLMRKFDGEFAKSGISQADICSKFINNDENLEKVNWRGQHNLYVVPARSVLNLMTERFEPTGPMLIDGLSSFNHIEFTISGNKASSSDGDGHYFFTTPSYDDPEIKEITVKIRTNGLKGRMDFNYNSEPFPIIFFVEFIEFKVKKKIAYQYESKSEKEKYNKSGTQLNYPHGSYARSNTNNVDIGQLVNIENLSEMKLKIPKISSIKNLREETATFMHSTMLFMDVKESLLISLKKKLNQTLVMNCP